MSDNLETKRGSNENQEVEVVLSLLPKNDIISVHNKVTKFLEDKYGLSHADIEAMGDSKYFIPITVFSTTLSPSEAITKFLKDSYQLHFSDIATILHKETSSIWSSYKRAGAKIGKDFKFEDSKIKVPANAFSHNISVLEALVVYLKDVKGMKIAKLSEMLKKSKSTLWTAYNRGRKKLGK